MNNMLTTHWRIFETRAKQIGIRRAIGFTALNVLRRCIFSGAEFHFGMTAEDVVILFLADKYLGRKKVIYVDVGCHEPRRISNSYLLYLNGSSGLVIDLDPRYGKAFSRQRPRDVFVCAAVSDMVKDAVVHEFSAAEVNTIDEGQAKRWQKAFDHRGSRSVRTVKLSSLLTQYMVGTMVDVLLLDVEGHELEVLRGASLATVRPAIVVCELHDLELARAQENPVVNFLSQSGYSMVAYATVNGYFVRSDLTGVQ